jgi:NAD(P)-dependent dehydrogenase (short-subunit alcohol dehydrogenase family)
VRRDEGGSGRDLIEETVEEFGGIDALANNAGVITVAPTVTPNGFESLPHVR